jgi:hypothetical protein
LPQSVTGFLGENTTNTNNITGANLQEDILNKAKKVGFGKPGDIVFPG